MNRWHKVWSSRQITNRNDQDIAPPLSKLLSIDGFDSGTGLIGEEAWLDFTKRISDRFAITDGDSIYDVGCGAGAFLYPFSRAGSPVGGLDYAAAQIDFCKHLFKTGEFSTEEAINLTANPRYSYVMSFSVFFYFPDLNYASTVLRKMLRKARKGVLVLDVPDAAKRDECEKHRASTLPPGEYERRYKDLEHLYYHRSWFARQAETHGWNVSIEDQFIKEYANNSFRFNCYFFPNPNGMPP